MFTCRPFLGLLFLIAFFGEYIFVEILQCLVIFSLAKALLIFPLIFCFRLLLRLCLFHGSLFLRFPVMFTLRSFIIIFFFNLLLCL
uniref:Candidate secreted effector n=1 Tax=Meloidogyne incognita TaxID=6306 RepID=A0A914NQC2_MELIC